MPPRIPGIPHQKAIRAFVRAGYPIARQGKHVVLTNGQRILTVPRHNPVNALTMGALVKDAGLTVDEFKALL